MSDVTLRVAAALVTLGNERGSVTISVTNTADVAQRIVLSAYGAAAATGPGAADGSAAGAAQLAAATAIERPLREISPGATEEFVATITRDGVPAGTYGLSFLAFPADRAPEEYGDDARVVRVVVPAPVGARRSAAGWVVALVAGVLVVAGALAFVLTRPSSVIVPGVVGQSAADAEEALRAAGLDAVVETELGPEPLDTVVGQDPPEGSQVGARTSVTVVVRVGVTVPDVVGLPVADAVAALGADVDVELVPQQSEAAPGTVLRVEPASGTTVVAGSTVVLDVASERTVTVPDVTGLDDAAAADRLAADGLRPRVVEGALCRLPFAPVCTVVVQDPAAGSRVPLGTPVTIRTT